MHLGISGTKSITKLIPRLSGTGSVDFMLVQK